MKAMNDAESFLINLDDELEGLIVNFFISRLKAPFWNSSRVNRVVSE